jgi:leucyl/phenylalanyl-tRNA--protein transferase
MSLPLTPHLLLRAYAMGIFPMADSADDPRIFWVEPATRGIIPLNGLHVSRRLARTVRRRLFEIRVDSAFDEVVAACAAPAPGRERTWINGTIRSLYGELHRMGFAHSVECWQEGRLVGGLYGVALGAAFFGESMFSRARDASKVALVHLVARLNTGGYRLLDTQFVTDHLRRLGAVEISRIEYLRRLDAALKTRADFHAFAADGDPATVLRIARSGSDEQGS